MNRYTQLSSASYNPMTLQELMLAPSYLRGKHDESENAIAGFETELAKVNPLDVHADLTSARQKELYDELSGFSNELATNGFTNLNKSSLIKFNKKYQNEISPTGLLGKANAAKSAYIENFNNYIEDATKNKKWSREDAIRNWNEFEENYTGFDQSGNITNIGQLGAPEKIDLMTKLKAAKDLLGEQVVNELGAGNYSIQPQQDGSLHVINRNGRRIETSNAPNIQNALKMFNSELSDPNSAWRQSIEFEGLDTGQLANQINSGFASMLSNKVTDNRSQNITVKSGTELGIPNNPNNLAHEAKEASYVNNTYSDIVSTLDNILAGKTHSVSKAPIDPKDTEYNKNLMREYNKRAGKPITINDLPKEHQDVYKKMFDRIKLSNENLSNINFDNPEAIKIVRDALDKNRNILRQDQIITDDFVKQYGDRSTGISSNDPSKIEDYVYRERDYRKYAIDGEVMTYDELPDDIKKGFKTKMQYSGYYSPKNFNTFTYGSKKDKNLFVSPIVYKYTNDKGETKEVLISRSNSELNSPAYKADALFNDIFTNTNLLSNIPYKIPNQNSFISYSPDNVSPDNPDNKPYIINSKDKDGNFKKPMYYTEEELQSKLYDVFGVPVNSNK